LLEDHLYPRVSEYLVKYPKLEHEEIHSFIFYEVNEFYKTMRVYQDTSKSNAMYLCPGCLFLGKKIVVTGKDILHCSNCSSSLLFSTNIANCDIFKTFAMHSKSGAKCELCERFIPTPNKNLEKIKCPYLDCYFVGPYDKLKKMHHPSLKNDNDHV